MAGIPTETCPDPIGVVRESAERLARDLTGTPNSFAGGRPRNQWTAEEVAEEEAAFQAASGAEPPVLENPSVELLDEDGCLRDPADEPPEPNIFSGGTPGVPRYSSGEALAGPRPPSRQVEVYNERVGARGFAEKVLAILDGKDKDPTQVLAEIRALVEAAMRG